MSRNSVLLVAVAVVGAVAAFLVYNSDTMRNARLVSSLVDRNIEARGGADAWSDVNSLRLTGSMDIGQDMVVPYVLEQKRPGKMCFDFVFNDQPSTQCTDGETGWKVAPFRGRPYPELMTTAEQREMADSSDPYGLLYDFADRNIAIEVLGQEALDGNETYKLQLTLPQGAVRWLYLDAATGLEVKLEAMRKVGGKELRVNTWYSDWQPTDNGLLIARRLETATEGDEAPHFLTVESVTVNPPIDDARFAPPPALERRRGS